MAGSYDTSLIREAARQVEVLCQRLDEGAVRQIERAQEAVEGLKGRTAEALDEEMRAQRQALRREVQHLQDITAKMRAFANALDDADRQTAEYMRGRG